MAVYRHMYQRPSSCQSLAERFLLIPLKRGDVVLGAHTRQEREVGRQTMVRRVRN